MDIATVAADESLPLKERFEMIVQSNELLLNENALLESALSRIQPDQFKQKQPQQRHRKGREKERLLTIQQKIILANNETDRLQKEINDKKEKVESLIESANASMDVFQAQINDIQKESFEFRKNVVVEGTHQQTGKVMSERVIQFFDNMYKEKCNLLASLQAKHSAMEQKLKRLAQFDAQSKESGDSLEEIDYEQLKIENQLFQEKISQRNRELLTFKVTAVSTQQILNKKKRDLAQEMKDKDYLVSDIEVKKASLDRIDEEMARVDKEKELAFRLNRILTAQHKEGDDKPKVMDYLKQKVLIADMEKAIKSWERKLEIAERGEAQRRSHEARAARGLGGPSRVGMGTNLTLGPRGGGAGFFTRTSIQNANAGRSTVGVMGGKRVGGKR